MIFIFSSRKFFIIYCYLCLICLAIHINLDAFFTIFILLSYYLPFTVFIISKYHKAGNNMVMSKQSSELWVKLLSLFLYLYILQNLQIYVLELMYVTEFLSYIYIKIAYKNEDMRHDSIPLVTFENWLICILCYFTLKWNFL